MPRSPAWIQFQGLTNGGFCGCVAVDCQQSDAEVVVGSRTQRIVLDSLARQVNRFAPVAQGSGREAGEPEGLGVAGFQVQCSAKAGVRARPVPVVVLVDPAHRQMRVNKLWIERQRLLRGLARSPVSVRRRRETGVRLPCVCLRQTRPGWGVARIALARLTVVLDCTLEVFLAAPFDEETPLQ